MSARTVSRRIAEKGVVLHDEMANCVNCYLLTREIRRRDKMIQALNDRVFRLVNSINRRK